MAGRTRAIRAKAFFGMKKMDKEGGEKEESKNGQKNKTASSSAHIQAGF